MSVPRSVSDVARDIVDEMKHACVSDANEADIADVIRGLQKLFPLAPFRGYRGESSKYAAKLIKWIKHGQELMAIAPENSVLEFALGSAPFAEPRAGVFGTILREMTERSTWIIENKVGVHGNAGYQQERAAILARGLMEKHRLPLAYSSPTSTYRAVARLFFEGMAGQTSDGGEDIERACEVVAKLPMMSGLDIFARL